MAVVALLLQALAMWPMCEHLLHLADLNRHSDGLYPAPRHPLQDVEFYFPIRPRCSLQLAVCISLASFSIPELCNSQAFINSRLELECDDHKGGWIQVCFCQET